jgi:hypothetical protein
MKHISYPEIGQFRNIVSSILRMVNFTGLDEKGEAIYDPSIPKPTLKFNGTVKLHGTNAGVSYNAHDGLWVQSRENIITPQQDNAGFAFFVESHKDVFLQMIMEIFVNNKMQKDDQIHTVTIFGEWAGKGIQKGMGITNLEKSFFIFGVKISKIEDPEFKAYWVDSSYLRSPENKIYNIEDYQTYEIDVDFNMPQLAQNKLVEITIDVENECPVGKAFGFSGIGEGVVWSTEFKGSVHRFKVKGEKHSASKVKVLAEVDIEKLNSIKEFVDYAVTENRFNQAMEKVFGLSKENIDVAKLGDLLRWMVTDIMKEEMDTMVKNNIEPKEVNKYISQKTKEMFFTTYNKF